MTDLFKNRPIIPKTMKRMGIYGDYILEVRGDNSQKDIMNVVKHYDPSRYHYVITSMKNWIHTRLGRDWWRNKEREFESTMRYYKRI